MQSLIQFANISKFLKFKCRGKNEYWRKTNVCRFNQNHGTITMYNSESKFYNLS
jgi:hypothetical protein